MLDANISKFFTPDVVHRKVCDVFAGQDPDEIVSTLNRYQYATTDQGRHRVALAILKLCDEEKLSSPEEYVEAANRDFRDVIAWAEYPNQMRLGPETSPEERDALIRADREQHLDWLEK